MRHRRRALHAVECQGALAFVSIDANPADLPMAEARGHSRFRSSDAKQCLHGGVVAVREHQADKFREFASLMWMPAARKVAGQGGKNIAGQNFYVVVQVQDSAVHQGKRAQGDGELADTRQREEFRAVHGGELA